MLVAITCFVISASAQYECRMVSNVRPVILSKDSWGYGNAIFALENFNNYNVEVRYYFTYDGNKVSDVLTQIVNPGSRRNNQGDTRQWTCSAILPKDWILSKLCIVITKVERWR